jgi:hypothetical protein
MVTLGVTCLAATIFESKHGTAAAQREIYQTGWFAAILVTLGINIFCAMMSRYPWKKHHTGFVLAHIGILLLLTGSLISLHYGFDGNMAVFEGETTDGVALLHKIVDVEMGSGVRTRVTHDFERRPARPDRPKRFPLDGTSAVLVVEDFTPHVEVEESFVEAEAGSPALHFVLEAPFTKEDAWLAAGDTGHDHAHDHVSFGPASFSLHRAGDAEAERRLAPAAGQNHLSFVLAEGGRIEYVLSSSKGKNTRGVVTAGTPIETPWMGMKVIVDRVLPRARSTEVATPATPPDKDERRRPALKVRLENGGVKSESRWVAWSDSVALDLGERRAHVAYRAPQLTVPFRVTLKRFNSDKYPGSNMAATYESFVRVDDPERGVSDHHISMNHPLHYRGYIFFQASFVEGQPMMSIFSVARAPGLPLVYLGTTLISLGVLWMFYVKPYLARRQAAQALAAHRARQESHESSKSAAPATPAAPGRPEPARG